MLKFEKIYPENLAYDMATNSLMNFLFKHYNLNLTIPQTNNYVIFYDFFQHKKLENKQNSNNSVIKNYSKFSSQNNNNTKVKFESPTAKMASLGRDLVCNYQLN